MDSLTQVLLGAAVGYAIGGKDLGKKSVLIGATAGIIPDLDVLPLMPFDNEFFFLKHHRGFSHSLVFSVVGAFGFTWLFQKFGFTKTTSNIRKTPLFKIFLWGFLTHIILDCCTTWGTQVFWPLPQRIAFNSVFIIDLLYTLPLLVGVLIALISTSKKIPKKAIQIALILSTSYLILGLGVKAYMHKKFLTLFDTNNIDIIRYTSRPSPFNIVLWTANAETKDGYYYGMVSLFDSSYETKLYFTPKNHHLLKDHYIDKDIQELLAYTKGYYSLEPYKEGILIHDLRYGFMGDPWLNNGNFVFSYYVRKTADGNMVLTTYNPRPNNTSELLHQLWARLKGI